MFRFSPQSTHSEHLKLSRKPDIFQRSEELQKKKGLFFPRGNASHIRSWHTAMRTVRGSLEPLKATTAGAPFPKDDRAKQLTDPGHQHPPGTPLERRRPTNRRHCRSAQPARGGGGSAALPHPRPETSSGATASREGRRRLRSSVPPYPGSAQAPNRRLTPRPRLPEGGERPLAASLPYLATDPAHTAHARRSADPPPLETGRLCAGAPDCRRLPNGSYCA